mgnify:CR=1 FL=1
MKTSLIILLLILSASAFSQDYYYPPQSRPNINYDRSYTPGQNDINKDNPALHRQHNRAKEVQRQLNKEMEYQDQRQMYNLMNGRKWND